MSGCRKTLTTRLARNRAKHSLRAGRQRFPELQLGIRDLRDFVARIEAGAAALVDTGADGKQLYHLCHAGRVLGVLYHAPTRTICTLLPEAARLLERR